MADESDVEAALVDAAANAIYPAGPMVPPAGGYPCRLARGEPNPEALNADLTAGVVNVAVTIVDKLSRNTTRYTTAWQPAAVQSLSPLGVTLVGGVATFDGDGGVGAIIGVLCLGQAYSYVTVAGDTPTSVAAAMAAQIAGAGSNGPALALPSGGQAARAVVYGYGHAISELRRQEQGFRVAVFAPTPDARSAVAGVIDQALAGIDFLALPDGSGGRLRYRSTRLDDVPSRANLWRRDLIYTVEYGTTDVSTVPDMVFGTLALDGAPAGNVTRP